MKGEIKITGEKTLHVTMDIEIDEEDKYDLLDRLKEALSEH